MRYDTARGDVSMKKITALFLMFVLFCGLVSGQVKGQILQKTKALMKVTVAKAPWKDAPALKIYKGPDKGADIAIMVDDKRQVIEGFGGCFNEKGWEGVSLLPAQ